MSIMATFFCKYLQHTTFYVSPPLVCIILQLHMEINISKLLLRQFYQELPYIFGKKQTYETMMTNFLIKQNFFQFL